MYQTNTIVINDSEDGSPIIKCKYQYVCILNQQQQTLEITCPICHTIYENPRTLRCKQQFKDYFRHTFCKDCIKRWADDTKKTCPLCRVRIRKIRGDYGKQNKKLRLKIYKLKVKCRKCNWKGCLSQYICKFKHSPFLQDQETFNDNIAKNLRQNEGNQDANSQIQKMHTHDSQKVQGTINRQMIQQIVAQYPDVRVLSKQEWERDQEKGRRTTQNLNIRLDFAQIEEFDGN